MKNTMKTFVLGLILLVFLAVLAAGTGIYAQVPQGKFEKGDFEYTHKKKLSKNQLFRIGSLKAVETTADWVKFLVTYYIPPSYPETCYIAAFIPNQTHRDSHFTCTPAGVDTVGVFKGQTHFKDNQCFQVQYVGHGTYTSRTIEVVIYDHKKTLQTKIIRWKKTWQGRGLPVPAAGENTGPGPGPRIQVPRKTTTPSPITLELYGGFATLNPQDLNLRADHESGVEQYYNDEYLNYQREMGNISSWSKTTSGEFSKINHALPLGFRIKYRLDRRWSVSLGCKYLSKQQASYIDMQYIVQGANWDGSIIHQYSPYTLSARGIILLMGVHYRQPVNSRLDLEGFISAGPMKGTCSYGFDNLAENNITGAGRKLHLKVEGTGIGAAVDGGVQIIYHLGQRIKIFAEGAYAFQQVPRLSGPGEVTYIHPDYSKQDWKGQWNILEYSRFNGWGVLNLQRPSNGWDPGDVKVRDFVLDLSGFQVRWGLAYGF